MRSAFLPRRRHLVTGCLAAALAVCATAGPGAAAPRPAQAEAPAAAESTTAQSAIDLPNWMAQRRTQLHDRPLNAIAMPGSHDAASWSIRPGSGLCTSGDAYDVARVYPAVAASMARTQSGSLTAQLDGGARVLDLRLCKQDGRWYAYHGSPLGNLFFDADGRTGEVAGLADWIRRHPAELVILRLSVTAPAAELTTARGAAMDLLMDAVGRDRIAPRSTYGPQSPYGTFVDAGRHVVVMGDGREDQRGVLWPTSDSDSRGSYAYASLAWYDYLGALFDSAGAAERTYASALTLDDRALTWPQAARPDGLFSLSGLITPDITVPGAALAQMGAALGLVPREVADAYMLHLARGFNARLLGMLNGPWQQHPAVDQFNVVMTDDVNQNGQGVPAGALQRAVIALNDVARQNACGDPEGTPAQPGRTLRYQAHLQNIGWQPGTAADGAGVGTTGQSRPVEALRLSATGTGGLWARAHVQNIGWQPWVRIPDGGTAEVGTTGRALRLEALELRTDRGTLAGRAHVQNVGWQPRTRGQAITLGTTGRSLAIEALSLTACD
ncbi:hypothetical protein LG634_26820 [Streptomyces bambusae]|uniref:hypothetical protein n=1 Tax=Streptomyces bambusae TaxID=1550616 RepID=UPI001CFE8B5B|nr:hypothetical protein [Streptomyces bambusae]MCB5168424.1 hypothetical protein [Streptomyces bambusae]